jgi:hypothetical protein
MGLVQCCARRARWPAGATRPFRAGWKACASLTGRGASRKVRGGSECAVDRKGLGGWAKAGRARVRCGVVAPSQRARLSQGLARTWRGSWRLATGEALATKALLKGEVATSLTRRLYPAAFAGFCHASGAVARRSLSVSSLRMSAGVGGPRRGREGCGTAATVIQS